jgi:hypothetical protein
MAGGISASARAPAELSPVVHEVPALLEKVTTSIGGLDRVADSVGKGLLNDMVRVGRRLGSPVSERAAKAMDGHIALLHLLQHIRHGHVAKGGSSSGADEYV